MNDAVLGGQPTPGTAFKISGRRACADRTGASTIRTPSRTKRDIREQNASGGRAALAAMAHTAGAGSRSAISRNSLHADRRHRAFATCRRTCGSGSPRSLAIAGTPKWKRNRPNSHTARRRTRPSPNNTPQINPLTGPDASTARKSRRNASSGCGTAYTRSWAADSRNARVRLTAERDRLAQEVTLLREEIRIKDARLARIEARRRPHYPPTERLAILALRAARGWSLEQTAKAFLVTADTVASWMKRADEAGEQALVQTNEPVNKFPDFVRTIVQRLKTLCPTMGKVKIAETLARAGLHLGVTTVGRILKQIPRPMPDQATNDEAPDQTGSTGTPATANDTKRVVTAKYPAHVWHVDLTAVSILGGFWTTITPGA